VPLRVTLKSPNDTNVLNVVLEFEVHVVIAEIDVPREVIVIGVLRRRPVIIRANLRATGSGKRRSNCCHVLIQRAQLAYARHIPAACVAGCSVRVRVVERRVVRCRVRRRSAVYRAHDVPVVAAVRVAGECGCQRRAAAHSARRAHGCSKARAPPRCAARCPRQAAALAQANRKRRSVCVCSADNGNRCLA